MVNIVTICVYTYVWMCTHTYMYMGYKYVMERHKLRKKFMSAEM